MITTERKMMSIDRIQQLYIDTIRLHNNEIQWSSMQKYYHQKVKCISSILRIDTFEKDIENHGKYVAYQKYTMSKADIIKLFYRNIRAMMSMQDAPIIMIS
ncbi:MAG: hypothetical protein LKI17_01120 [Megasphaera cerevisiae]|jgi:hypothetical protein|nr:hypothetical protein [Megasphaera cerevisiae]